MPGVQSIRDIQTPEMAAWIQTITFSIVQEQIEKTRQSIRNDALRSLERAVAQFQAHTDSRLDRLEIVVGELAEAQKRTEMRVEELAEAQKRTEARVEELAEAQKRTEARVGELAEAQKRTEARLDRLEIVVGELAEAQKRAEARLDRLEIVVGELAEAQKRTEEQVTLLVANQRMILGRLDNLESQVGLIGNLLGIEAEGEAEEILVYILGQKGYRLIDNPHALAMNGEVDIVLQVETPEGEQAFVLTEVKARARLKELRRWSGRLHDAAFRQRLADAGVTGPFLPYFFGLRVYQVVDEEAARLGIGVFDPNGERVAPALLQ